MGFDSDPGLFDRILDFKTAWDHFVMPQPGTNANYIEENKNTDDFITALDRANQLMGANDGKIYVFIAGTTRGWLFADFDGPDTIADFAILLRGAESLPDFAFTDLL